MEKQEFYAMFGIYFGQFYHGLDPVLQLAHHNWEFYEKSNFNEKALEIIVNMVGIIKQHRQLQGQVMVPTEKMFINQK